MKTMSVQQARDHFSDLLGSVYYTKEAVVVEKKGKPVAVVVSPEAYERLIEQEARAKERFWQAAERIRERNKAKDPDAELAYITQVVEEVRQERYERKQAEADGRR